MATQRKKVRLIEQIDVSETLTVPFNWSLCVICQEVNTEKLQCPAESKRDDVGAGYASLASNLADFASIGALPAPVRLSALDEGPGVTATLLARNAKWHKSCRNKVNSLKLQRLQKKSQSAVRTLFLLTPRLSQTGLYQMTHHD